MLPSLILNDTVKAKLVSVPYFTEVSLLDHRSDLLQKYHFTRLRVPGANWSIRAELSRMGSGRMATPCFGAFSGKERRRKH